MIKPSSKQVVRGHATETGDDSKPKILIVDDEEGIVTILRDAFESDGWHVHTAGNGIEALGVISEEKFDVVLSDLHMPQLNGIELVSRVKEQKLNEKTKVCIISGHLDHENLKEITNLGVSHVVVKPFVMRNVTKKIRETCLAPATSQTPSGAKLRFTFDTNIIRCVINAVEDVTAFYLNEKAQFGKPYIKTDSISSGCMTAMIEMSRYQVLGSVALSCDINFLKHLAKSIFQDNCAEIKADMLRDMAGEICNQISGKIKLNLLKNNYHIQIGLPQIMLGRRRQLQHLVNGPVVNIPMTCKGCAFSIEFAMRGDLLTAESKPEVKGMSSGVLLFD
jgi:CheY-like chemotaxis protein